MTAKQTATIIVAGAVLAAWLAGADTKREIQAPIVITPRPIDLRGIELTNPNITKVVVDRGGYALYFSRAPIPHQRDPRAGWPPLYKHIGLYGYRRSALLVLAALDQTPLERAESLEQLRALEHGIRIKAVESAYEAFGVDTPEDLEQVRRLMAAPPS